MKDKIEQAIDMMVEQTPEPSMLYWGDGGQFEKEYHKLWNELVPDEGEAETSEGELLRAFARIMYDRYNNGFGNGPPTDWWDTVIAKEDEIKKNMVDPARFDKFVRAFERIEYGEDYVDEWEGDYFADDIMDGIIAYIMQTQVGILALGDWDER